MAKKKLTRAEAEDIVIKVLLLKRYAEGTQMNEEGPRRTHNPFATRQELRQLFNDPDMRGEWDTVAIAARLLRATGL